MSLDLPSNRVASANHLNLYNNDYIPIDRALFNSWFVFKNKAEQSGLFSKTEVSRIDGINQILMNHLRAHREPLDFQIDRDMALMIWDVYHIAKHWPLVTSYFIDTDVVSEMESIINTIKSFCIDKSIDEVIR